MRQAINKLSNNILKLVLPITAFLVPLFFIPNTTEFFTTNKQLLLNIIASFALLAWSIKNVTRRQIRVTIGPATVPLLILALVYILSSAFQAFTPLNALMGRTSTIISLIIIFLTTSSSLSKQRHITLTFHLLAASITIAGILHILQYLNVVSTFTSVPWLQNKVFNLVGGPLPYLTIAIPLIIPMLYYTLRTKNPGFKSLYLTLAGINLAASIMAITQVIPVEGTPQIAILPLAAGWSIAVDIFKNWITALIGTGPGSFANTFTILKPGFLNQTNFWNTRFSTSSNEFLHILTTAGFLGFTAYAIATLRTISKSFNSYKKPDYQVAGLRLFLILLVITQLIVPGNIPLLTTTFVVLSLLTIALKSADKPLKDANISFSAVEQVKTQTELDQITSNSKINTEILPVILLVLSTALVGTHSYFRYRTYASESNYYQSLQAAANNDGTSTYNYQIKAIALNPRNSRLRIAYSQTNLALATTISAKEELTDQDRNNVAQLIQQSIREAKAATTLDPNNSVAWANLAGIYRQLINLAQGADQWSVAAYTQAITVDPLNPQLRLDLGGIYYSLGNFDQAIRIFNQATEVKPDWANAYYNLAAAYKEAKLYPQALQAMRIVTGLIDPTSPSAQVAQDSLLELEKLAGSSGIAAPQGVTEPGPEDLTTPEELAEPNIEPIELPEDSGFTLDQEATDSAQNQ